MQKQCGRGGKGAQGGTRLSLSRASREGPAPLRLARRAPYHPSIPSSSPLTIFFSPIPTHLFPQAACYCPTRWVAPEDEALTKAADGGGGGKAFTPTPRSALLTAPAPADLAWSGLTCTVLDRKALVDKVILHPNSGVVLPGEMCALVGPSGAGKSTLLDMLAGRKTTGKLGGTVFMNGRPAGKAFKRNSAYVAQEDVFVPTLTAYETLTFHARLRAERGVPDSELAARTAAVLAATGLTRARDTTIGGMLPSGIPVRGLSGGEKRRLTVACSLVARPSLLFLDEPTTGLDSFAALNIMDHMCRLASGGLTIVATIHQPRAAIWAMFHKVLVLSEGHQLFFGAPDAAAPWFDRSLGYPYDAARDGSVSDWLMDLVSVAFPKPDDVAARSMTTRGDVEAAAAAWAGAPAADAEDAALLAGVVAAGAGGARKGASITERPGTASATRGLGVGGGATAPAPASASSVEENLGVGGGAKSVVAVPTAGTAPAAAAAGSTLATPTPPPPPTRRPPMHRYPASYWTQFRTLFRRSFMAQMRNPTDVASRTLLSTWVGTIGGLVFIATPAGPNSVFQRLAVLFFTMMIFELLPFCYMSLYIADRKFYAADVASGLYHPCAYYLAHTAAASPFIALNAAIGGLSAYGLANLRFTAKAVFTYAGLAALGALIAVQLVVLCVYLTPNQDLAFVLAVSYVAISILLGGFYAPLTDIKIAPLRWLSYLSYPRYTFQGMVRNELLPDRYRPQGCLSNALLGATEAEINNLRSNTTLQAAAGGGGFNCKMVADGKGALSFWDFTLPWKVIVPAMLAFYFGFHILSYLALSRLHKAKR
jgi:ATP-binding cassette, subfamily G (WHITE), member 2